MTKTLIELLSNLKSLIGKSTKLHDNAVFALFYSLDNKNWFKNSQISMTTGILNSLLANF